MKSISVSLAGIITMGSMLAQAQNLAESERLALIAAIQKRVPGQRPEDWTLGAATLATKQGAAVEAVPFNAENATNTADIIAIGKKAWDRKFKSGKTFATCFPNGGKRIAATYPQYDPNAKLIVTLEMAINRCLKLHGEVEIDEASGMMGPLSAYLRSLAQTQRLAVRVSSPAAKMKFDLGQAIFARRMGQKDLACASCHVLQVGIPMEYEGPHVARMLPMSPVVGQAASWPKLERGGKVRTLQKQFQLCMKRVGAEPFSLASEEFNNLEYFHAYVSNGFSISTLTTAR